MLNKNYGFSLIEALVAVAILSCSLIAMSQLNQTVNRKLSDSRDKIRAYYLALDLKEEIKVYNNHQHSNNNIDYKGTRFDRKNLADYSEIQRPPKNILNRQMNDYPNFTREVIIRKVAENDFTETADESNYYLVKIIVSNEKQELAALQWVEIYEKK